MKMFVRLGACIYRVVPTCIYDDHLIIYVVDPLVNKVATDELYEYEEKLFKFQLISSNVLKVTWQKKLVEQFYPPMKIIVTCGCFDEGYTKYYVVHLELVDKRFIRCAFLPFFLRATSMLDLHLKYWHCHCFTIGYMNELSLVVTDSPKEISGVNFAVFCKLFEAINLNV